jgi:hypothetical protein
VDPRGVELCNSWCLLLDGHLERLEPLFNALLSCVDVRIARKGGSSNCSEFRWIHTGVGWEITFAHFSSWTTLYNASLLSVHVHILGQEDSITFL